MAGVISLKEMCLGKISVHIWINKFNHNLMIARIEDGVKNQSNCLQPWKREACQEYNKDKENIVNQVQKLLLPNCIKLQASLCIIDLTSDLVCWCQQVMTLLNYFEEKGNKPKDVINVLKKTLFKADGGIDRANSVVQILFDSKCKLAINDTHIGSFCNISKDTVLNYATRYDITDKALIKSVCSKVEKYNATYAWSQYFPEFNYVKEIGYEAGIEGNMDIFEYFYNKQKDGKKKTWLVKMIIKIIKKLSKTECANQKIKYIYLKFNSTLRSKVIKLYGYDVVKYFFGSSDSEYLIIFYKQVCKYAPEHCDKILKMLFLRMVCHYFECCHAVFSQLIKEQFLKIWYHTPADIKNNFVANADYKFLSEITDTDIINTLIKDEGLTDKSRRELLNFLLIYHKCCDSDKNKMVLENICQEFDLKDEFIDLKTIKELTIKHFANFKLKIESGLFKSEQDLMDLKNEFSKDSKCIIQTIKYMLKRSDDPLQDIELFLYWCFNKEEALKFFKEVFIYDNVFVDAYQLYLEQEMEDDPEENDSDSDVNECGDLYERSNNVIKQMHSDETVVEAMKVMIKKTDFVNKTIIPLIGCKAIKYCFENLLTDKEKCEKIRSYILSEDGLKEVFQRFIQVKKSSIENVEKNNISCIDIVADYANFVKHWVLPYHLGEDLTSFMIYNGYNFYHKHFQPPVADFFPRQGLIQFKYRVNCNFAIFVCLISPNCPRHKIDNIRSSIVNDLEIQLYLFRVLTHLDVDIPELFPDHHHPI